MLQSAKSPPAKYAHRDKVEGNETNYILEAAIWFKVLLQLYEQRFLRIAGVLKRDFSVWLRWTLCRLLNQSVLSGGDTKLCPQLNDKDADFIVQAYVYIFKKILSSFSLHFPCSGCLLVGFGALKIPFSHHQFLPLVLLNHFLKGNLMFLKCTSAQHWHSQEQMESTNQLVRWQTHKLSQRRVWLISGVTTLAAAGSWPTCAAATDIKVGLDLKRIYRKHWKAQTNTKKWKTKKK